MLLKKNIYRKRTIISVLLTILIINYFTVGFIKYTITREIRKQFYSPEVIYHSSFDEELLNDHNGVKYCSYTNNIVGPINVPTGILNIKGLEQRLETVQLGGISQAPAAATDSCNA